MFMSHSLYPGVWMTHPLQLLQTQILRSGLTQPGRRRQSQTLSTGGASNAGFTVTPTPTSAPTPSPVAAEATGKSKK